MKKPGLLILCLLVALAVILVILGLFYLLLNKGENVYEVGLPLLAIIGVICLLAVLTFVSVAFSSMDLADKTQALALPDGSVRAVIALSLIVIFAITSIYFYTHIADRPVIETEFQTKVESDNFARSLQPGELVAQRGPAPPAQAPAAPDPRPFKVLFRASGNQSSDDFAKQVLTMIGTLVTAVSSFYFGSKAAAGGSKSAAPPAATPPLPKSVAPTSAKKGGDPQTLKIAGVGLQAVNSVRMVQGETKVAATQVEPSDNLVSCTIALTPDLPTGLWDIVVETSDGQTAKLQGAFSVTA